MQDTLGKIGGIVVLIIIAIVFLFGLARVNDYVSNYEARGNTDDLLDGARSDWKVAEIPICQDADEARPLDSVDDALLGYHCASSLMTFLHVGIAYQAPDIGQIVAAEVWVTEFITSQRDQPWLDEYPELVERFSVWEDELQEVRRGLPEALFQAALNYLSVLQTSAGDSRLETQYERAEQELNAIVNYLIANDQRSAQDLGYYLLAAREDLLCAPTTAKPHMASEGVPNCLDFIEEIHQAVTGDRSFPFLAVGAIALGLVAVVLVVVIWRR